jgi:pyrrolidone-carboxylate peptidase
MPNTPSLQDSGGNYFSNEIHYRVTFLNETIKPSKRTGYIYIGFLKYDVFNDRKKILDIFLYKRYLKKKILLTLLN